MIRRARILLALLFAVAAIEAMAQQPQTASVAASPPQIVKADEQWASEGQYTLYASPWCKLHAPTLQPGRDYLNTIAWTRGTLPSDVQITYRWPESAKRPAACGVWGYNHISWGNYDGGATYVPVAPRQVKAIVDLTFSYGVDISADPTKFSGLLETYLTTEAGRDDLKAIEIGFFWNAPPEIVRWAATTRQLGVFTDRYGKRWNVAVSDSGSAGRFATFIPVANAQLWGGADMKGAIDFLRARGLVDERWWFNGAAIGVEPLGGFGTVMVRRWVPTLR